MCTELEGVTIFVYLASWTCIVYFMIARNHALGILALIVANAIVLYVHLVSECHVNFIKTGAATEAVLLLLLCIHVCEPKPG